MRTPVPRGLCVLPSFLRVFLGAVRLRLRHMDKHALTVFTPEFQSGGLGRSYSGHSGHIRSVDREPRDRGGCAVLPNETFAPHCLCLLETVIRGGGRHFVLALGGPYAWIVTEI